MYEEAHIDKHCHSNSFEDTFLSLIRFNQVIARFMEYALYNPNTLVIITADHETGGMRSNFKGCFTYDRTSHSSQFVPVFAYGDGGELFDARLIENVQIPQTVAYFWGVENFGDQSVYTHLAK